MSRTYRVLLLGDIHFGENYNVPHEVSGPRFRYRESIDFLKPFIDSVDTTIANLETPLLSNPRKRSPLADVKAYCHWGSTSKVLEALSALKVSAVSLETITLSILAPLTYPLH